MKLMELARNSNIKLMKQFKSNQFYNVENNMDLVVQIVKNREYDKMFRPVDLERMGYFCKNNVEQKDDDESLRKIQMSTYAQILSEHGRFLPRQMIPNVYQEQLEIDNSGYYSGKDNEYFKTKLTIMSYKTQYNMERKQIAREKEQAQTAGAPNEEDGVQVKQEAAEQQLEPRQEQGGERQQRVAKQKATLKLIKKYQMDEHSLGTFNAAYLLAVAIPRLSTLSQVNMPISQQLLYRNPRPCLPTHIGQQCQASMSAQSYSANNTVSFNVHQFSVQRRFSPFANLATQDQFYYVQENTQINEAAGYGQFFVNRPRVVFGTPSFYHVNRLYYQNKANTDIQLQDKSDLIQQSGKLIILQKLLQKLYEQKSKVLLFT